MVKKINSNSKKGINLKLNLNFSNKTAYTLIAIIFLLAVGGIVYAYNSNPANPAVMGHTGDEIDGISKILDCLTIREFSSSGTATAVCPENYTVTGGGINFRDDVVGTRISRSGTASDQFGNNSWYCYDVGNDDIACYARCCKIS